MVSFVIGAVLRTDSHWTLPALLLGLSGIGSAFFNTASQAAKIRILPKEQWGTAIGIINGIFGLGHMLGISLSGIFLTLAFRFYTGNPAATPNPTDTGSFVVSRDIRLDCAGAWRYPLVTSIKFKRK
jgi:MFS family permease